MSQKTRPAADIDVLIGKRVRSRRIQTKVSQTFLGKALGVTLQQIERYEKGTDRIGVGRLLKIAEALECDITEFYVSTNCDQTIAGTPFSTFMATKDGVAIIKAMLKIKNQALRRTVIDIAEKLAET
jgi:transcriptional regulator with XRE-family HTH domain